jgi:5-formyltetrahydrofolate cyclo-ligase
MPGDLNRHVSPLRRPDRRAPNRHRPTLDGPPDMTEHTGLPRTKAEWRTYLLERRRAQPAEVHAAEAELLAAGAVAAAAAVAAGETATDDDTAAGTTTDRALATRATADGATTDGATTDGDATRATVCCYVPITHEPGSLAVLDALHDAGLQVLLPIVPPEDADQPVRALDWALYRGPSSLVAGPYGLRQPAGPGLGPDAITSARLVLVPALAVDRRGVRLGRGAGWYDRTLPLARRGASLVAVVRDVEVVDNLPADEHDVQMSGVLTPHHGLRALPLS